MNKPRRPDMPRPTHLLSPFRPLALVLSLLLALLTGCSGSATPASSEAGGDKSPIVIGQTSVLSSLDPFKKSWGLTAAGVGEYVFMLQPDGTQTSRFVEKVERVGDNDWTMTVKDGPKFSDGSAVDAQALADCLNSIQKNNSLSNASAGCHQLHSRGNHPQSPHRAPDRRPVVGAWRMEQRGLQGGL